MFIPVSEPLVIAECISTNNIEAKFEVGKHNNPTLNVEK